MHTKTKDIIIATAVALLVAVCLAVVVETLAFKDAHINRFIASYE